MRSAIFLLILGCLTLLALRHPWIGVLSWTWVSIMNPHKLAYGAEHLPVAAIIGGATLIGLVISSDKKQFFITPPVAALIAFMVWVCITHLFAFYPEGGAEMLSKVLKIDFMILVALVLLYSKQHIIALVWVLVISIGFYGVKGGIFTIKSGGSERVWGPVTTFIEGNNEVALAMIIVIPFMYFLRESSVKLWQKNIWLLVMGLTAVSSIGSQSRGALLAISAMALVLWWRSKQKFFLGVIIVTLAIALVAFMPDSWHQRMDTINTYEEDASAMGRINAWWMAWNLACSNIFGGGFDIYSRSVFALYAPNPLDVHAAHSIYFQVLGEHGFFGLALFLLIWILVWRDSSWLIKNAKDNENTEWAARLGAMCQVSLVGYAVGGAFLSLAYFDLPYNILVLIVLAKRWVKNEIAKK